jgi:hypothetical protein
MKEEEEEEEERKEKKAREFARRAGTALYTARVTLLMNQLYMFVYVYVKITSRPKKRS